MGKPFKLLQKVKSMYCVHRFKFNKLTAAFNHIKYKSVY